MCGICGKIISGNNSDIKEELIHKMCGVLEHRGPDDEGVYLNRSPGQCEASRRDQVTRSQVGLGHRRLSIIDASPAGHQPMSNEDGSIWIVLNGEIYNFQDLRASLVKQGHRFRSRTDTEVILHLYEEKGAGCLSDLRGAFAFAIWDENRGRLFLARDRIGKKPLYYFHRGGTLIFASEIKAILADPQLSTEVNRPAITDYLTYGYTPTPQTMFKGVKKLPPAHFMTYEDGVIRMERYWRLNFSKKMILPEAEYCERIMLLLEEATRARLVSDVPLGAFLSGGIDSSAVVYMMSKIGAGRVKTFSIGFEEQSHSELKYAGLVARHFGTEHHEYIVRPRAIEVLPKLVWHYNEPYADSSALPSYYVAKMTRQEVKVALNGDGGDEDFGGYERFMAARFAELYRRIPEGLRTHVINAALSKIPTPLDFNNFQGKLKRFLITASKPCSERHYNWVSIFRDHEKEFLFADSFKNELNGRSSFYYLEDAFRECGSSDVVDAVMCADITTNLLDDLLVKMDIATMANSLEGRSPFLDHKLMEFAATIPSGIKIRGTRLKYILKKALAAALPEEILSREKMGFGIPIDKWFRGELKDYARDILLSGKSIDRGYFKDVSVRQLLDAHASGRANHGARIWSLLNLELWHRIFIDKENM
ncbi:MAG: asparagine synthase (glutamine-hydrolyzing) [Candidatus Omnitrophica bacterium]|nr:asparagine synthase (glutamine-hydrolyzing) [Candidatus Omnitrophota bacterium]